MPRMRFMALSEFAVVIGPCSLMELRSAPSTTRRRRPSGSSSTVRICWHRGHVFKVDGGVMAKLHDEMMGRSSPEDQVGAFVSIPTLSDLGMDRVASRWVLNQQTEAVPGCLPFSLMQNASG